ncbi:MAG: ABC transporter permease [Acidobacteria bacterium]|nr:ABC transporter permease [Acidobacteriota bacterium]
MSGFMQDLRFGLRMLAKTPGFTAVAVLTLAFGIAANSVIFSLVDGVLVRRLDYPEPEELMMIRAGEMPSFSPATFLDLQRDLHSFEAIAGFAGLSINLTGAGEPVELRALTTSGGFFTALGTQPFLGRAYGRDDEAGGRAAVLSHELWQRQFAGDPEVVGGAITLDGESVPVLGVMPAGFRFGRARDLWLLGRYGFPDDFSDLGAQAAELRDFNYFRVFGRLAPGVTRPAADGELEAMSKRLSALFPEIAAVRDFRTESVQDALVGDVRPTLLTLQAAVFLVLLIACVNVANLLLARATGRRQEMAVRAAMGAGRLRLLRQSFLESQLLCGLGAALGLLLAIWGLDLLLQLAPENLPRIEEVSLDSRSVAFALALSFATGTVFGLLPALSRRLGVGVTSTRTTESVGLRRLRSSLVIAQVALALVLLVGAGLLLRSFSRLQRVDPGFVADGVFATSMKLPQAEYPEDADLSRFYSRALEEIRSLPQVSEAGAVSMVPLSGSLIDLAVVIEGQPPPEDGEDSSAVYQTISPSYLRTVRLPLLSGRDFGPEDRVGALDVALVSQSFARRHWPDGEALGRRFTFNDRDDEEIQWFTVVGVVADVHHIALDRDPGPQVYTCYLQAPSRFMSFMLRASGSEESVRRAVVSAIGSLDASLPAPRFRTLPEVVDGASDDAEFRALVLGSFAAMALALAALGIFGVMAYSVSQRTRELGIRMALGAGPGGVLRLVLIQGVRLIALGLGLGLAAALALGSSLQGLLFQIQPTDPPTFTFVPLLLALIGLAACYLPARRALAVEPTKALRQE